MRRPSSKPLMRTSLRFVNTWTVGQAALHGPRFQLPATGLIIEVWFYGRVIEVLLGRPRLRASVNGQCLLLNHVGALAVISAAAVYLLQTCAAIATARGGLTIHALQSGTCSRSEFPKRGMSFVILLCATAGNHWPVQQLVIALHHCINNKYIKQISSRCIHVHLYSSSIALLAVGFRSALS